MSAPAPVTVYASPLSRRPSSLAEPVAPTGPTSACCQPLGSVWAPLVWMANTPVVPEAGTSASSVWAMMIAWSVVGFGLLHVHWCAPTVVYVQSFMCVHVAPLSVDTLKIRSSLSPCPVDVHRMVYGTPAGTTSPACGAVNVIGSGPPPPPKSTVTELDAVCPC